MADILIPDVPDDVIAQIQQHAEVNGRSLADELRALIAHATQRPFTADEARTIVERNLSRFKKPVPSLSLDDIREGLEGLN